VTSKTVRESQVVTTQLVLPNDTNQLGNLLGGTLMHWMDIVAAICAQRHSGRVCVTASVDELTFHYSIGLGETVTLQASVNRAFRTSMEIGVLVTAQERGSPTQRRANTAYFTFVALDEKKRPVPVPAVVPETATEERRFEEARVRREVRLGRRSGLKERGGGA
jgi:acyl-CoA hydrolase